MAMGGWVIKKMMCKSRCSPTKAGNPEECLKIGLISKRHVIACSECLPDTSDNTGLFSTELQNRSKRGLFMHILIDPPHESIPMDLLPGDTDVECTS